MSRHVLVVEDQEDNRRIVRDLFLSAGYQVSEATNGEEALSMAEELVPDLIIMDVQLPLLDGHEATRRLKENPDLKSIPVIIVTSYALSGDEQKARQAGGDAYLSKPVSPTVLLTKVREFVP